MKLYLVMTFVLAMTQSYAQQPDCDSPTIKYKKAKPGFYIGSQGHAVSCLAFLTGLTVSKPFYHPDALDCQEATDFYREVGWERLYKSCAKLVSKGSGYTRYLEYTNGPSSGYTPLR